MSGAHALGRRLQGRPVLRHDLILDLGGEETKSFEGVPVDEKLLGSTTMFFRLLDEPQVMAVEVGEEDPSAGSDVQGPYGQEEVLRFGIEPFAARVDPSARLGAPDDLAHRGPLREPALSLVSDRQDVAVHQHAVSGGFCTLRGRCGQCGGHSLRASRATRS